MSNIIHPLDSLSVEEIEKSVALFKKNKNSDENSVFSYIILEEPDKEFVNNFKSGEGMFIQYGRNVRSHALNQ